MTKNKKQKQKGILKILLSKLGKYKTPSILCPIFTACESLMEILIPFIIAYLIDLGIEKGDMANVYKYGLIMAVMAIFSLFSGYMAGRTTAEASSGFATNLREAMYKKIQTYSFANIDKFSTAGLVTRMTTDVTNVQNAYQMVLRIASKTPFMLFLSLIMCFRISASLSMIFLVAVAFLAICLSVIMVNAGKYYQKTFIKYDGLNENVEENISGIKVVKAFVREDYEKEKFSFAAGILRKLYEKAESFTAIQSPVMMTSIYGCILGLSWFGAKAVYNGSISTGNLTSLFSYIMLILISIMMFSMVFVMITMAVASAHRIAEVLTEEPTITNPNEPIMDIQDGKIDFNHVEFKYCKSAEEPALQDIDIHIRSGETIGIIGGTGSGKSTLVALLSRIYDVTDGSVQIGGIDVRKYDLTSLRDAVSVVLQKNVLFSGTILSNLRWGKENATEKECIEACKMACADEFIEKKHDKYLEKVEQGGSNFSGGQKQRLCIARALLKSPKVLVLDDSTSAVDTATDTMRQLISQTIPQFINGIVTMVISLISMFIMSVPLSFVSLVMVAVQLLAAKNIVKKSHRYFQKQQKDLGHEDGYIEEMIAGQKIVKVFNYEKHAVKDFKQINDELNNSSNLANRYANILMPVNVNLGNLSYILIAVVGAGLSIANLTSLTLGKLISFLTLNRNFSQPIAMMSQQINYIAMAMAGSERIFGIMDESPEIDEGYVELVTVIKNQNGELIETSDHTGTFTWKHPHKADKSVTYQELKGKITMDHVDFSYDGKRQILHDITLLGMPGEKIAFVGSTGAGKTTITNLLNRFYSIADGKIRYDDININKIKMGDLRRSLGIVLQDVNLFTGTILDNIRYGKLDATDEECIDAAKLANADSFIRKLPEGYNTIISSNGGSLSQGERQLLSIARVAVANPPVMILDEATSSIDTRTEAMVQKGMDALMQGRTTFVIAHRLSTVQNSDSIMVMEQGEIIERGTHNELLKKKGRYYQLYTGNKIAS